MSDLSKEELIKIIEEQNVKLEEQNKKLEEQDEKLSGLERDFLIYKKNIISSLSN